MRTFAAIALPASVKSALADLCQANIPDARWVHPSDFHLTLRFIGDTNKSTLQRYRDALSAVDGEPFPLTVQGVGRFPQNARKRPRVLWADVVATPKLLALQKTVDNTLQSAGLPPDRHPTYTPHITLARLRQASPALDDFLEQHRDFTLPPVTVNEFTLFQNKPNPDGGKYTSLATYPLD